MEAAPKIVSPILLCWSIVSEADASGMALGLMGTFPPIFFSILLLCKQQRGSLIQEHLTW